MYEYLVSIWNQVLSIGRKISVIIRTIGWQALFFRIENDARDSAANR